MSLLAANTSEDDPVSSTQTPRVHFSIPGATPDTLVKAIEIVRKYSSTPVVAAELAKLKAPGTSHSVFAASHSGILM